MTWIATQDEQMMDPGPNPLPKKGTRFAWLWSDGLLATALAVAILLLFGLSLYMGHFAKAWSDPAFWVSYAKNFWQYFISSSHPPVCPLDRKLVSWITADPFLVFLANLPVLLALAAAVGVSSLLLLHSESDVRNTKRTYFTVATACALVAGFDFNLMRVMVNPYRDLLSFLFLFVCLCLFIKGVGISLKDILLMFFSGLFCGLAYSTRETSLLIVPCLLVSGLAWCWHSPAKHMWRHVLSFGLGLLAGAAPLILQNVMRNTPSLLPPHAMETGNMLPGLVASEFRRTLAKAWGYCIAKRMLVVLIGFVVGTVIGANRRNKWIVWLFLPAVALYFTFYSFYLYFVRRYFSVVVLLSIPIAAYGYWHIAEKAAQLLAGRIRVTAVHVSIVLVLGTWTALDELKFLKPEHRFDVGSVRRFAAAVEERVPSSAFIVAPRPLSDMIKALTPRRVEGLTALFPGENVNLDDFPRAIKRLELRHSAVYCLEPTEAEPKASVLLRIFSGFRDTKPLGPLRTVNADMEAIFGKKSTIMCYQLLACTQTVVRVSIPSVGGETCVLINPGFPWRLDPQRSFLTARLNSVILTNLLHDGANYLRIPPSTLQAGTAVIEVESDRPIPSHLEADLLTAHEMVHMDLGVLAVPYHGQYAGLTNGTVWMTQEGMAFKDEGSLYIPVLWQPTDAAYLELSVAPYRPFKRGAMLLKASAADFSSEGVATSTAYRLRLLLPLDGCANNDESVRVRVQALPLPKSDLIAATNAPEFCVGELRWIKLHRVPARRHFSIQPDYDRFKTLTEGFYPMEKDSDGRPFSWTAGHARVHTPLESSSVDLDLVVEGGEEPIPARLKPMHFTVLFNGRALPVERHDSGRGRFELRAIVAKELVGRFGNIVEIISPTWTPATERPSTDRRTLGLMVYGIRLSPHASDAL